MSVTQRPLESRAPSCERYRNENLRGKELVCQRCDYSPRDLRNREALDGGFLTVASQI